VNTLLPPTDRALRGIVASNAVTLALEGAAVWLFVLLKTGADVVMHKVEHRVLQQVRAAVAQ